VTYTNHGHHVPGTPYLGSIPDNEISFCGGTNDCPQCIQEAVVALREQAEENDTVPENFSPYVANVMEKTEELRRLIVGAFQNSRERSLALTNIEQGEHWLGKCTPADPVQADYIQEQLDAEASYR
jgi:hypothetical protein